MDKGSKDKRREKKWQRGAKGLEEKCNGKDNGGAFAPQRLKRAV